MKQSSSLEAYIRLAVQDILRILWYLEDSLTFSQKSANDFCPEPDESSPRLHSLFLWYKASLVFNTTSTESEVNRLT
jgi:hypothetical protein